MKVVTILGARPQFIKASPVSKRMKECCVDEIIVHTGQHFDGAMSDIFFEQMDIPAPKYNLNINGVSHGAMTGRMLESIEQVLQAERPDVVLVYGDTNSTLAGALAAKKMLIPVAHVEAGLRSFNMRMPEEINRILTDRISDILFCPTQAAVDNLKVEGFDGYGCRIEMVGDVMLDAALLYKELAKMPDCVPQKFILCTLHRQENTDNEGRFETLVELIITASAKYPVVWPLHPRIAEKVKKIKNLPSAINLINPVGYLEMLGLLSGSVAVMTDSGGLQKEAYFMGRPCITLRDETEWVELVSVGANKIVGSDVELAMSMLDNIDEWKFDIDLDIFGGGESSLRIVKTLLDEYCHRS